MPSIQQAIFTGQAGDITNALNSLSRRTSAETVGNVAKSLTTASAPVQIWNTALTADRAVSFAAGHQTGEQFRIVRTAAATGAFNLNVASTPAKALTAGQWADVVYDGTNWVLVAAGSL